MDDKQYKKDWEEKYLLENGTSYCNDWRKKNHERFRKVRNAYQSQKLKCECGCEIRLNHMSRHQLTKKHIDLLAEILNKEVAELTLKV